MDYSDYVLHLHQCAAYLYPDMPEQHARFMQSALQGDHAPRPSDRPRVCPEPNRTTGNIHHVVKAVTATLPARDRAHHSVQADFYA